MSVFMLQFDEYKIKLNDLKPALDELGEALDLKAALADYYTRRGEPVPPECVIDDHDACPHCG